MMSCAGYCCCEQGFYWKSPKTVYQKEKGILGKAAATSFFAKGQQCVPKAEVPAEVVEALRDSKRIPGSERWVTCSTFTSNSHTCGSFCCCNGGFHWSAKT